MFKSAYKSLTAIHLSFYFGFMPAILILGISVIGCGTGKLEGYYEQRDLTLCVDCEASSFVFKENGAFEKYSDPHFGQSSWYHGTYTLSKTKDSLVLKYDKTPQNFSPYTPVSWQTNQDIKDSIQIYVTNDSDQPLSGAILNIHTDSTQPETTFLSGPITGMATIARQRLKSVNYLTVSYAPNYNTLKIRANDIPENPATLTLKLTNIDTVPTGSDVVERFKISKLNSSTFELINTSDGDKTLLVKAPSSRK